MLQRDYIMHLVRQFIEALEKLVEEKKKEDGPEFQLKIQSIYRAYFNHSHHFYYEQDAEYILTDLSQDYEGQEFLTRYVIGVALSRRSIERAGRKEIPFSKSTLSKRVFGQP